MARYDPDHAARLLSDTEGIANFTSDKSWKASALSRIAREAAATDAPSWGQAGCDVGPGWPTSV